MTTTTTSATSRWGWWRWACSRGDKVAIIGDNRPEWVWSEIAAQAAGGASVGLYQDSNLTEVAFVIDHCDATFVVAEDQEQVDKILDMLEKLPKVRNVVFTDPRGLRKYQHPKLLSFEDGRGEGARAARRTSPALWEEHVRARQGRRPRHHLLHLGHHRLPQGGHALLPEPALHGADPPRRWTRSAPTDEFVSFLPLAWIGEQMMSLSSALAVGLHGQLPRGARDGDGEHPRDRPARDVRAAAHLGER